MTFEHREEFNKQLKILAIQSGIKQRIKNNKLDVLTTNDQERDVERLVALMCKNKPIRKVTTAWILNDRPSKPS